MILRAALIEEPRRTLEIPRMHELSQTAWTLQGFVDRFIVQCLFLVNQLKKVQNSPRRQ
jgi:hypothetical protein